MNYIMSSRTPAIPPTYIIALKDFSAEAIVITQADKGVAIVIVKRPDAASHALPVAKKRTLWLLICGRTGRCSRLSFFIYYFTSFYAFMSFS